MLDKQTQTNVWVRLPNSSMCWVKSTRISIALFAGHYCLSFKRSLPAVVITRKLIKERPKIRTIVVFPSPRSNCIQRRTDIDNHYLKSFKIKQTFETDVLPLHSSHVEDKSSYFKMLELQVLAVLPYVEWRNVHLSSNWNEKAIVSFKQNSQFFCVPRGEISVEVHVNSYVIFEYFLC